jgi:4-amino-4-deoxy-L-arabinose transferase-like glycosyltransferase
VATEPTTQTDLAGDAGGPEVAAGRTKRSLVERLDLETRMRRPRSLLLALSLVSGAFSHGWHLFKYPLYITDEGIYVQQAWSVLREGTLSPYTYFYDHAPAGWMAMAMWANILPGQFQAFGNEINTIRVLMLVGHVIATGLMFGIVRRFSSSSVGAFAACFLFNFSPLAIYYQRQVLLDNLMVVWVLLAVYLVARGSERVTTAMAAGLAFGLAIVTKENAIFFAPAIAYLIHRYTAQRRNRRFVTGFWWFAVLVPVGFYVTFAQLKRELFPSGLSFDLDTQPGNHVSLLYTVWWQLNRSGPAGRNLFQSLMENTWMPRDSFLLVGGAISVAVVLWLWWQDRDARRGYLVLALMAIGYGFYMTRGSMLLDFYVVPMVAVLAMNIGLVYGTALRNASRSFQITATACIISIAMVIPGGYFVVRNTEGNLKPHDLYELQVTPLQDEQLAWVRENIPPNSRIIIDDDIWTALHDRKPIYPYAHSHYKAASDPAVRDKLFRSNWQNIDYVVMSNKMREAMNRNNAGGQEQWILDAIDQHGQIVWRLDRGDIHLAVYRIE